MVRDWDRPEREPAAMAHGDVPRALTARPERENFNASLSG